jgi:hypothetical protein
MKITGALPILVNGNAAAEKHSQRELGVLVDPCW